MILGACDDGSDAVMDADKSTPPCADNRNTCTIKRLKEIEKLALFGISSLEPFAIVST